MTALCTPNTQGICCQGNYDGEACTPDCTCHSCWQCGQHTDDLVGVPNGEDELERRCPKCYRCQYFDGCGVELVCERRPYASVQPAPVGQFAPMLLCREHVGDHCVDHSFRLGNEWAITPLHRGDCTDSRCIACPRPAPQWVTNGSEEWWS